MRNDSDLVIPLHSKADGIVLPVVAVICFAAPFLFLFAASGLFAVPITALLLWPAGFFFASQTAKVLGAELRTTAREVALWRRGREVWTVPWSEVKTLVVPESRSGFMGLSLEREGRPALRMFCVLVAAQTLSLIMLLESRLPSEVRIEQEAARVRASRSSCLIVGFGLAGAGIALLMLAFQNQQSTDVRSWEFRSVPYVMLLGLALVGFGVRELLGFVSWSARKLVRRTAASFPISNLFEAINLADLGTKLKPQTYSYPASLRSLILPQQRAIGRFSVVFLWSLVLAAIFLSDDLGLPKRIVLVALALLVAISLTWAVIIWWTQLEKTARSLDVSVEYDGEQFILLSGGKRQLATLGDPPKVTAMGRDSSGLNRSIMSLKVGEETYWLDPLSMTAQDETARI